VVSETAWEAVDPFDESDVYWWIKIEHLGRYLFAADFLESKGAKAVLDAAVGTGYGAVELLRTVPHVIAVDSDERVLKIAARNIGESGEVRLTQTTLAAGQLVQQVGAGSQDAVVSFETIEHIVDVDAAIQEFADVLKPGGFLIASVPNRIWETVDRAGLPTNSYHKQLFDFSTFRTLLEAHGFTVTFRLGQAPANLLMKAEAKLLRDDQLRSALGEEKFYHQRSEVYRWARILGYPSLANVHGSYSLVVVAQRL
jgi:ubiquinone/menaquinone biosynthesis C-methylase UbiE